MIINNQLTEEEKYLLLEMLNEDIPILNECMAENGQSHELYERWIRLRDLELSIVNKLTLDSSARREIINMLVKLKAIDDDSTVLERLAQIEILEWVLSL